MKFFSSIDTANCSHKSIKNKAHHLCSYVSSTRDFHFMVTKKVGFELFRKFYIKKPYKNFFLTRPELGQGCRATPRPQP